MASEFDSSDFVDSDFQSSRKKSYSPATTSGPAGELRPPSTDEMNQHLTEAQQRISELKRAQEHLEKERATLEETRRRQMEFENGRQELLQHLTRGVGLLEEAEFAARRDAEQMSKTLSALKEGLDKVAAINESIWNRDNYQIELTRALTTLENARMEWNGARLKHNVLTQSEGASQGLSGAGPELLNDINIRKLFKVGLALTWPVVLVGLLLFIVLIFKK
ncbi:MAG: hypothetical protein JWM04_183 [Verrucomicrobiales bacterium]|nr:hypothetical protein [Verrucomicrobiales bacterium]